MAGEALRRLYAEVGWKIDEAPLRKLDKLLDEIKASMLGGSVEKFERDLKDANIPAKRLGQSIEKVNIETKEAERNTNRLTSAIRRTGTGFAAAYSSLNRYTNGFQRLRTIGNNTLNSLNRGILGMARSMARAPFTLPGMIIGGATAYTAVRQGFVNPLRMAGEFEQAEIAFTTMLGSAEKARKFIEEMNRFAIETPFDVAGVQDAAKRMLAFGFRQEQIIPYLTAIGSAAAGLGGGTDLIDRISLAIGQMQAKAKVSAEEMLQLTEAGIPAWEILAKKMNTSTQEVMNLSSKGLIPASKAIEMLIEGMNERFPNMLQKQAESLDGLRNQITETFSLTVVKRWGDGLARALKPRLESVNRWIENNDDKIQRWGKALERTAYEGFDYLLRQGERVFEYIRTNYLENEEFQKLPFDKKIRVVFSNIENELDNWYRGGGKQVIESGAQRFVEFSVNVLEASVPRLAEIGIKLGKSIGSGLISGLSEVVKDHPILSGIAVGLATPGPLPLKIATAAGTAGGGFIKQALDYREQKAAEKVDSVYNFLQKLEEKPSDQPLFEGTELRAAPEIKRSSFLGIPGFQSGISYVPKNDMIARLHEGERVLTKQENREYSRAMAQASFPNINATINVNVSAEAAAEGAAKVKQAARQGAKEALDTFWRSLRRNYPAITEV